MEQSQSKKRRGQPATTDRQEQIEILSMLLREYGTHKPFWVDVAALRDKYWTFLEGVEPGQEEAFERDLVGLSAKWKLDRLPEGYGIDALRRCLHDAFKPGALVFEHSRDADGSPRITMRDARIGELSGLCLSPVDVDRYFLSRTIGSYPMSVNIDIDGEWAPARLSPTEYKALMLERIREEASRQIDGQLRNYVQALEERGVRFPDTSPRTSRNVRWLFEHMALRKKYWHIGVNSEVSDETVKGAVHDIARRAAINIGGV